MSFFTSLMPLLQRGVKFSIAIEAADAQNIALAVMPQADADKTKSIGVGLAPRLFTATPAEFDAEFAGVMQQFAAITTTLADQLDAARVVADEAARTAAATAQSKTAAAVTKPKPKGVVKPTPRAAATLIGGDDGDGDDGDGEDGDGSDTGSNAQVAIPAPAPAAVTSAAPMAAQTAMFDL